MQYNKELLEDFLKIAHDHQLPFEIRDKFNDIIDILEEANVK